MHILFADAIDASAHELLRDDGHTVTSDPSITADTLPDHLAGVDAVVVRSTKVSAATFAAADRLALVVRAGSGVDTIDVAAASGRGVFVSNVPGRNAAAVAELTMGLLLSVDRHIAAGTADLREGIWNKKKYSEARGLLGRTIGIVGLGEIGLAVAERAKAFGMVVVGVRKPNRNEAVEARIRQIGIRLVDSLNDLAEMSDVLTVHAPGGSGEPIVNESLLALLRPGSIVLNTSRGDVVDEDALVAAMNDRGIRAGLDVYSDEPGSGASEISSKLAQHPNVVGTHHIGASTQQAQMSVAHGVVDVVRSFMAGDVISCVNLETRPQGQHIVRVRHQDRVGVLAAVLNILRQAGLNVQQMENSVFRGAEAAVAAIRVQGEVTSAIRAQLEAVTEVFGVSVVDTGTRS